MNTLARLRLLLTEADRALREAYNLAQTLDTDNTDADADLSDLHAIAEDVHVTATAVEMTLNLGD